MMQTKKNGGPKEIWRKFLVSIKRRPQMIPLAVLVIAFLFYSLNLMHVSDTTARIQGPGMGLAGFATMLFSMLSFMCFLNAFPYRKKPNIPMVVLMFVMVAIVIFADVYYCNTIIAAVQRPDNPIAITEYIAAAYNNLRTHVVILVVGVVLTVLLPVYSKWLRKIKTSIDVGDNGSMAAIDISGEA
ncbi:MAG: hypothetical protein K2K53_12925 [Oscillospiraceae bacterium]|nr:hypothetical protein [Oscillospiraceae bacterium]